jgi:hypothetical protein
MCVVYRCFAPRIAQINEDAELLALSQAYLEAMPTDIADQLRPYASGKAVDAASKPPVDSEMLTHTSQPSDGEQVDAPRPERAPRFKAA